MNNFHNIIDINNTSTKHFMMETSLFDKRDVNLLKEYNINRGYYMLNPVDLDQNVLINMFRFYPSSVTKLKITLNLKNGITLRKYKDEYYIIQSSYIENNIYEDISPTMSYKYYLIDQLSSLKYFFDNINLYL